MTKPHSQRKRWILTILTLLAGLCLALALPTLARAGQFSKDNPAASANAIIYVAKTGDGSNGSSWAQAYTELQDALAAAESSDQIWVATGVYTPGVIVTETFQLLDAVAIYGGFDPDSGADLFEERDWQAFPTVLSGDIGGDDSTDADGVVTTSADINGENSYHVVTGSGVDSSAVLDGFTITAGQANGAPSMFLSCGETCGGGIYNVNGSPILANLTFSGNQADARGGGMFNYNSSPTLIDMSMSGNSAETGGGLSNLSSSNPTLENVTLRGNSATINGGGIYNWNNSNPSLDNVTVSGNSATANGGGIFNFSSSNPNVRNSILWNNQDSSGTGTISATITNLSSVISLTHSLVQGSGGSGSASWTTDVNFIDLGGNLDTDPLFLQDVDPSSAPTSSGDLRLGASSPAINAGDNQYVTASNDLDGQPRISGGTVDMGAYEFQCPSGNTLYVDQDVAAAGYGGSWETAYSDLQAALSATGVCSGVSQIWVAIGVYTPGTTVTDTFQLLDGVAIYGGFDPDSGADLFEERDWQAFPTVLSGDIDGDDTTNAHGVVTDTTNIAGSNAYHVVTGSGVDSSAVLDGFYITAGKANGSAPHYYGGGMYNASGSPALTDVSLSGNYALVGGGMYNWFSSPTLTDVTLSNNEGNNSGGGIYNDNSDAVLLNVVLSGNHSILQGGGMVNYESNPLLTNVTLSANRASDGGGMYNSSSSPVLTNATLSGNRGGDGGGMFNVVSSPIVHNSILWNNQDPFGNATRETNIYINGVGSVISLTHSLVQGTGGSDSWTLDPNFVNGGNNLDTDPLFILDPDPSTTPITSGDLRLGAGSPAINAGDNQYVSGVATDLDGLPRISGGTVDMGAYEFQFYPLTVSLAGSGAGSVSSNPAGIDCGTDCSEIYADGTVVTLTVSAEAGSTFSGWSGACTNPSGDCVVTMEAAREVTASFTLEQHSLAVSLAGYGSGSVSSAPAGISCSPAAGADCSASFDYGTVVTLTASADSGSIFAGWGGDCTDPSGDCVVTMTEARAVTATFHHTAIYLPLVVR